MIRTTGISKESERDEGTNKYLLSILDPNVTTPLPDLNMTPCHLKSVFFSNIFDVIHSNSEILFLLAPHSRSAGIKVYVKSPTDPALSFRYLTTVRPTEELSEDFILERLVSGCFSAQSATVTGNQFEVSGAMTAVQTQIVVDSTIDYDNAAQIRRNDGAALLGVPIARGVWLGAYPNGPHLFKSPASGTRRSDSELAFFEASVATFIASGEGWLQPALGGNTVIFDTDSDNTLLSEEISGRVKVNVQCSLEIAPGPTQSSMVVNVRLYDETADPITWEPVTREINNYLQFNLSTPAAPLPYTFPLSVSIPAEIVGLLTRVEILVGNVPGGASRSTDTQAVINIEAYDMALRNQLTPAGAIFIKGVKQNTSITISGRLNYETVPNARLAKNLPTQYYKTEHPMDMETAEQALACLPEAGLSLVMPLDAYEKARKSTIPRFCQRNEHTKYMASGWGNFIRNVGRGFNSVFTPIARETLRGGLNGGEAGAWKGFGKGTNRAIDNVAAMFQPQGAFRASSLPHHPLAISRPDLEEPQPTPIEAPKPQLPESRFVAGPTRNKISTTRRDVTVETTTQKISKIRQPGEKGESQYSKVLGGSKATLGEKFCTMCPRIYTKLELLVPEVDELTISPEVYARGGSHSAPPPGSLEDGHQLTVECDRYCPDVVKDGVIQSPVVMNLIPGGASTKKVSVRVLLRNLKSTYNGPKNVAIRIYLLEYGIKVAMWKIMTRVIMSGAIKRRVVPPPLKYSLLEQWDSEDDDSETYEDEVAYQTKLAKAVKTNFIASSTRSKVLMNKKPVPSLGKLPSIASHSAAISGIPRAEIDERKNRFVVVDSTGQQDGYPLNLVVTPNKIEQVKDNRGALMGITYESFTTGDRVVHLDDKLVRSVERGGGNEGETMAVLARMVDMAGENVPAEVYIYTNNFEPVNGASWTGAAYMCLCGLHVHAIVSVVFSESGELFETGDIIEKVITASANMSPLIAGGSRESVPEEMEIKLAENIGIGVAYPDNLEALNLCVNGFPTGLALVNTPSQLCLAAVLMNLAIKGQNKGQVKYRTVKDEFTDTVAADDLGNTRDKAEELLDMLDGDDDFHQVGEKVMSKAYTNDGKGSTVILADGVKKALQALNLRNENGSFTNPSYTTRRMQKLEQIIQQAVEAAESYKRRKENYRKNSEKSGTKKKKGTAGLLRQKLMM